MGQRLRQVLPEVVPPFDDRVYLCLHSTLNKVHSLLWGYDVPKAVGGQDEELVDKPIFLAATADPIQIPNDRVRLGREVLFEPGVAD